MGTLTLGETDGWAISIEEHGLLVCGCSPKQEGAEYVPCRHVFSAMKRCLDSAQEKVDSWHVPMYAERVEGKFLVIPVQLHATQRKGSMVPFTIGRDEHRVGWVDDSEGRQAMRLVLFEWLRAQYPTAPACVSTSHMKYLMSKKERKSLDLDSKSSPVIAALASVFMYDICWRCLNKEDSSDLIPDI